MREGACALTSDNCSPSHGIIGGVLLATAASGQEAAEAIKVAPPDIVFLDVSMSGMNGFEVCDIIRNTLKLRSVYVVMVTGLEQSKDRERGLTVGAIWYLAKPFDPDEIVDIVEGVMSRL